MTPGRKAQQTARWARIMTKWLVTRSCRGGAKWQVVNFNGSQGSESAGIVDLLAIRKDHRSEQAKLKRGDLFEIALIQTKGGSARRPTRPDVLRLYRVAKHYHAKAVVLAEWQCGRKLAFFKLDKWEWKPVDPSAVFG
ncbi:MAG: hypothetical protein KF751_06160 [Nitrospira sp.]|nr:hypothetical protein [Nitrospira sp.]